MQLTEQLPVGERLAVFVARRHQHAEDVVGRGRAPLGDHRQQHAVQFVAHGGHLVVEILLRGKGIGHRGEHDLVEQIAQMVYLRAGPEADETFRRDVEGDLARLEIDVDLAALGPVAGALGDDPAHDRQIAAHVGGGEGGIHHLAVARVLRIVGVEQPLLEHAADGRRPAEIVAEAVAVGSAGRSGSPPAQPCRPSTRQNMAPCALVYVAERSGQCARLSQQGILAGGRDNPQAGQR